MSQAQLNILVVEDDFFVKTGIIKILEGLGHEVVGEAGNGKIALEKTIALRPDVVLMDIKMNEMDGLEAAQHIHAQCPTPIIFITAYETPEFVEQASKAGASAYLVKPPNAANIDRALTMAMARHHDITQLRLLNEKLQQKAADSRKALAQVKTLPDLLPICCHCKKIRDDEGKWNHIETYIEKQIGTKFTHGICDGCMKTHHNLTPPNGKGSDCSPSN